MDTKLAAEIMELHEEVEGLSDERALESKLLEVENKLDELYSQLADFLENDSKENARKTRIF